MGLGFLVPAFLAGLAALAIPIVLHLRHRDKDRPYRFPSLMFLEQLPIRTAERRRITDLPLMLLRALAVALLVLAFTRPVFSRDVKAEQSKRVRAMILMVDRSMSMGHRDVWPAALDSARTVIASLGAGDRLALVLFDDDAEVAQPFSTDRSAALAVLAKARPADRGTRYPAALRAARQLAAKPGEATPEVVIITDLQRTGVSGVAGLDLPKGLTVRTIAVGPKSRANATVASVDIHRTIEPLRTMLAVESRIVAREGAAARTAQATLILNGRPSGTKRVTIPAAGEARVLFTPVLLPAGLVRGSVSIDNDALAADDTFHFAFAARDELRVLLVAPDDAVGEETLFFERALLVGHAPSIRIERVRAAGLDANRLDGAALVVLWDAPVPSGRASAALTEWVRRGGGLVVAAGRRSVGRASTSTLMPARIVGEADRLTDHGGSLGDARFDHPLFSAFRSAPAALSAARFLRYPRIEPAVGTDVLARFDDGQPAVVEHREGSGRIVLVGMPLDARSGDFPLQSSFLPFLHRLTLYTSGRDATPLARTTGQSWLLSGALKEPAVLTPDGSILRPARDTGGSTVALREAGVYALYEGRVQGEPTALLAVNAPANESDLTSVDPRELLLGVRQSIATADATNEVPTRSEVEGRQRLWRGLLIALAVLLLGETFMANRGWRGIANGNGATRTEGSAS
jgi:Mg-chelatase subunit ChlD